ncbi:MAG: DUF4390 domain-containing protein [Desulfonatronovibrionaceae bacterium]
MQFKTVFFLLCFFLALPGTVRTAHCGMELEGFVLDNINATAEIGFGLNFTAPEEIFSVLDEGETLELSCRAELTRIRSFIWDEHIAEGDYICILYRDKLNSKYVLECPKGTKVAQDSDPEDILSRLSQVRIPICPWSMISEGEKYSVILEAEMKTEGVPEWIRGPLFFWSWDLFDPVYYEMQFDY